jgi:nucleotide-binding universal stress UspA family protein
MKDSFKQLLVHIDASAQTASRMKAALAIAQAQGAAVNVVYAVTPTLVEVPFAAEGGAAIAATLAEIDDGRRAQARKIYDEAVARADVQAGWCEVCELPVIGAFSQQALYADLLVLGQHDPGEGNYSGVPFDFVETVLAASGKAAIVLPYEPALDNVGSNVVIAWKPTREAARAVAAAVPLLQRARKVQVIAWKAEPDVTVDGAALNLDTYLKQRGIEATWHTEGGGEPDFLGEMLLSRAFDLGADLMVMGCYGHSRAREWVLGGTSRTVLRSMTMPVLMAH